MRVSYNNRQFDLSHPFDIAIPFREGAQVNCYYAPPFSAEPVVMGTFIGDVKQGGVVNYKNVRMNPHGNGTHTECFGHIMDTDHTVHQALDRFHFLAQLITVTPVVQPNGDHVIMPDQLGELVQGAEAVILRTLPNLPDKLTRQYSSTNPPYLHPDTARIMREAGILHLLLDLPSADREEDGGQLAAHKAFWNIPEAPRKFATITELVFVPGIVPDGIYLLNLQVSAMVLDAAPSRPVLYPLI